jgi:hypothetical protein
VVRDIVKITWLPEKPPFIQYINQPSETARANPILRIIAEKVPLLLLSLVSSAITFYAHALAVTKNNI